MIVNSQNLDLAYRGFKTVYTDACTKAPVTWDKIAMTVPSAVREETYGWLGQFPQMREWPGGGRVLKDIEAQSYTSANRKFESALNIRREDVSDRLGIFKPMIAGTGHTARLPPEEPLYGLLEPGASALCHDGQAVFDADRPTVDADRRQLRWRHVRHAGSGLVSLRHARAMSIARRQIALLHVAKGKLHLSEEHARATRVHMAGVTGSTARPGRVQRDQPPRRCACLHDRRGPLRRPRAGACGLRPVASRLRLEGPAHGSGTRSPPAPR
nr:Mu-like prophage major head subunit gpT family protein [Palleronia rufa]